MPEIVFVGIRIGFLVLLWAFVLGAVRVVRTDLLATARPAGRPSAATATPARKPPRGRRSAARRLVVTEGGLAGTVVTLTDAPVTLGRAAESTLVLTDDYASTHHARLSLSDSGWLLEDTGSTNGTYLDRTKVTRPTLVPLGAPIRIGKTVLELRR